ncbi:MAG: transcriptional regulator NrdR [Thermodesulfobacteriota bacterium]
MKCPYCGMLDTRVIDSRLSREGDSIRRRRECIHCGRRFNTFESIEDVPMMIVKKDGRRELFLREKIRSGMIKACEKRNISMETIDACIDRLERDLQESGSKEIPSSVIGERVMAILHELDEVAYVRFASVYREFKDVNDFVEELKAVLSSRQASETRQT